jgi:DNA-directed RNA polymerase subunit beta'
MASSDINHLYQNAGIVNTMMKLPVMKLLHEDDKADIRKELHTAVSGISGLTDLNIKGKVREGFISEIKGGAEGQPKEGFFISKLLSRKQDFVGRGVIVPGTDLGVDEAGIPEEMCWKIFEPFVMRELTKMGKTPLSAKDEIKKRTDTAKKALEIVMADRHVLLNRSPSLHKFSIMAFKPKLVTGRSIELPHLVCQGFNADFDGDTMTVHTPISDAANEEAKKMLPSANLFKPGSGQLMIAPSQEAQTGLFYLSQNMAARAKLNAMLPKDHQITGTLDKKATAILLGDLARSMPGAEYAKIVNMMRDEGARHAYERGFTLGLNDLATPTAERNRIVAAAGKSLAKATTEAQAVAINNKANEMIDGMLARSLKGKNNPLYDMVDSGAKGNRSQLRQIMATPLMVADEKGRIVRSTIKKSYTEGLDLPDYWTSMYGARRGMMDRAVQTSLPGAFSKDIMATTIDNVISKDDCGTKDGIIEGIDDKDIVDRYLAGDQGGLKHNTLVDKNVASRLKKAGITQVKVRSPLKCLSPKGTCAHCFGLDEHGGRPEIGTNIGAKSGQAISEPLVQMGMNSFHSGGAVGSGSDVQGFARINQLLQMPKILAGAASLAPINGSIEKIAPHLGGGQVVTIGGQNVIVSRGRSLKFKVGDMVRRGDALTDGPIKPQDLVKLKGMEEAQGYLANQLRDTYKSQGFAIHKKIFETVVRSQGNTTQVLNNPKGSGYLPGDVAPWTAVQAYNKNLLSRASLSDASGRKLAESVSGIGEPGHVLSDADVRVLKARGLTEIAVTNDPIVHAPFLKSTKNIPMLRQDWMSALGYQKLQKTLTEGAAQGWSSDTNNYHPVPALAHGATFGQGKDGKY